MANFSPQFVRSVPCKYGCGKQLFWSSKNHWYADDAEGTIKHKCDTKQYDAILEAIADLKIQMSHEFSELRRDLRRKD